MKYIIEIPVDAQYIMINGMREGYCYTQTKNVDDLEELNSDYINEHFGELQDEAYQRGLEDAWEAARKIILNCEDGGVSGVVLREVFDTRNTYKVINDNTASEAIAKLKAYEDKQKDRVEVGDEVRTRDGAPSHTFLVTKVTDSHVCGISNDGSWNYWTKDEVTKTGKHYDIASILEAMRNDR
jgi:hypothetical protein